MCDDLGRPNAVYGCIFDGEERSHSKPELVFMDDNGSHFVDVQRTKGCHYVAIHSTSKISNEIYLVGGDLRPILVRKRQEHVLYYIDCGVHGDAIIMALKNKNHVDIDEKLKENNDELVSASELSQEFSVFETTIHDMPLTETFGTKLIIDDEEMYFIEDMDIFASKIVLYERSHIDGTQRMIVWDRNTKNQKIIPFPVDKDHEKRFVLSVVWLW
jgi:protease II